MKIVSEELAADYPFWNVTYVWKALFYLCLPATSLSQENFESRYYRKFQEYQIPNTWYFNNMECLHILA